MEDIFEPDPVPRTTGAMFCADEKTGQPVVFETPDNPGGCMQGMFEWCEILSRPGDTPTEWNTHLIHMEIRNRLLRQSSEDDARIDEQTGRNTGGGHLKTRGMEDRLSEYAHCKDEWRLAVRAMDDATRAAVRAIHGCMDGNTHPPIPGHRGVDAVLKWTASYKNRSSFAGIPGAVLCDADYGVWRSGCVSPYHSVHMGIANSENLSRFFRDVHIEWALTPTSPVEPRTLLTDSCVIAPSTTELQLIMRDDTDNRFTQRVTKVYRAGIVFPSMGDMSPIRFSFGYNNSNDSVPAWIRRISDVLTQVAQENGYNDAVCAVPQGETVIWGVSGFMFSKSSSGLAELIERFVRRIPEPFIGNGDCRLGTFATVIVGGEVHASGNTTYRATGGDVYYCVVRDPLTWDPVAIVSVLALDCVPATNNETDG